MSDVWGPCTVISIPWRQRQAHPEFIAAIADKLQLRLREQEGKLG